jgi:ornithine decarboxylase
MENVSAKINLSNKFGASLKVVPKLLYQANLVARKLGVSFHVGSQCMNPQDYYHAIIKVSKLLKTSPVNVQYLNIGGGFPSAYPHLIPPPLDNYFSEIQKALMDLNKKYEVLSEPGRALVAESMSLIIKVVLRKNNTLYVNDGTFGGLYDAGALNFRYPVRLISTRLPEKSTLREFDFYGPTCDSMDYMKGPFILPSTVEEGDYIEVGQMGAYSSVLSSGFNGYEHDKRVILINDPPILPYTSKKRISLRI